MTALLSVLLIAAVAFANVATFRPDNTLAAAAPDWRPYVDAGKTTAQHLTTINYQSADGDVQRILDSATGAFYDDFKSRSEPFKQIIRDARSVSTGTVTGAGLASLDGTQAQVLVAATAKPSSAATTNQERRSLRMRLTVNKIGDSYKTSNVEFVP